VQFGHALVGGLTLTCLDGGGEAPPVRPEPGRQRLEEAIRGPIVSSS
jgi:hypothetical protein